MIPLLAMMLVNHPADRDRGREADGDGFGPVICHPFRRPTAAAAMRMGGSGLWSMAMWVRFLLWWCGKYQGRKVDRLK